MNKPESNLVTCRCNNCDGDLEFDREHAGERVNCPLCGTETLLFIPSIPVGIPTAPPPTAPPTIPLAPPAAQASPPLPQVVWFGTEASTVDVRLTSGVVIEIKAVRLYNEIDLNSLAAEKANAFQLLEGVSDPYAPWGSPGWVVLASTVSKMLEQRLSRQAGQKGIALLRDIAERERRLRGDVRFFPVGQIQEIASPAPSLWRVPPQSDACPGFVHSGDEFVMVKGKDGVVESIRWSAVEQYRYKVV
jgi:hypothetical protein